MSPQVLEIDVVDASKEFIALEDTYPTYYGSRSQEQSELGHDTGEIRSVIEYPESTLTHFRCSPACALLQICID